jgi:hypothetical protein
MELTKATVVSPALSLARPFMASWLPNWMPRRLPACTTRVRLASSPPFFKSYESAKEIPLMEKIVSLCKRRGFIFQSSEIYGGINGFWDYGPLGAELKRNLRDTWWRAMSKTPAPSTPKTARSSASQGLQPHVQDLRRRDGEDESSVTYLRPETAQAMFVAVQERARQLARRKSRSALRRSARRFATRSTPRNFTFRSREFEQMELEFFIASPTKPSPAARLRRAVERRRRPFRAAAKLGLGDVAPLLGRAAHGLLRGHRPL